MKFTQSVNSAYNELLYNNFHDCTNLEKISPGFVPPFPRKKYWARQCVPNTHGFPDILPIGYYKVVGTMRGQVEVICCLILKLKPRLYDTT